VKLGAAIDPERRAAAARWAARAGRDLAASLRFFSILPLSAPAEPAASAFSDSAWAAPLAGALIGLVAAIALAVALRLGLPPTLAAVAAVATLALVSGCLHEDGLADFADGLAAGRSRDERLAIMRDSRIGAFGATTLTLTLIARVGAIAALAGGGAAPAAAAPVLAGAAIRPRRPAPPTPGRARGSPDGRLGTTSRTSTARQRAHG